MASASWREKYAMTTEFAIIGHNMPPGAIDMAREAYQDLAKFLSDNPVFQSHATAKEAKLFLDRTKAVAKDLADAEKAESAPIYEEWRAAKNKYAPAVETLDRITRELKARIQNFLDAEETIRRAEAVEAIRLAQKAIIAAQAAAEIGREAQENAAQGEFTDVGAAMQAADEAEDAAIRAVRAAAVSERDADNVRLAGGFGRSVSVRTVKKPVVEDWLAAIKAMGLTDGVRDAIITSARAWKKIHGTFPAGIGEIEERVL